MGWQLCSLAWNCCVLLWWIWSYGVACSHEIPLRLLSNCSQVGHWMCPRCETCRPLPVIYPSVSWRCYRFPSRWKTIPWRKWSLGGCNIDSRITQTMRCYWNRICSPRFNWLRLAHACLSSSFSQDNVLVRRGELSQAKKLHLSIDSNTNKKVHPQQLNKLLPNKRKEEE